jgi:peptidyl-prolyl cis-trans isomerase SurA
MRFYPRMKSVVPAVAISFVLALLAGCSPAEHAMVVATVGSGSITLPEYEAQYLKTLGSREAGTATSIEDRQKFLELLVKYRLKLADAYSTGLEKKPEVINELESYKGSLAQSYLTEREVVAPGVRQLFARRNEEIRASHILLTLSPDASPTDSALATMKAHQVLAQLKAGKDFGDVAVEFSQDPSVKQNRGDLYYFTAGQLVAPFEDAAFQMKPGEITPTPVRTQFGLHIIKVIDRKMSRGEVKASHIMVRFPGQTPSPEDTLKAYNRIVVLRDSLRAGVDFASLAQRHSEDPGSAAKGGDLGFFSRRRWVQPFDEVAMMLAPGELSGIVRTVYGYHLIKCMEVRPPKTFEEAKADLQPLYQQLRFQADYAQYLIGVRRQVGYAQNDSTLVRFIASLDSTMTLRDSAWSARVPPAVRRMPLYTVRGISFSVDSIITLIGYRPDLRTTPLQNAPLRAALDKIAEQLVYAAKADLLQKEYPDFADLLKEYREGILLYQVEQDNVWNRIVLSDSILQLYFNANRSRFTWPDRLNFTVIRASTDSLARLLHGILASGKSMEQVAAEDSVRMAAPTALRVHYAGSSTSIDARARASFAAMIAEMKRDRALRLSLNVHPDTTVSAAQNMKRARARLASAFSYLTKTQKLDPSCILQATVPLPPQRQADAAPGTDSLAESLDVYLSGLTPLVWGKTETQVLPAATDERSVKADSLQPGNISQPFLYNNAYLIVRLNRREKAREKTFAEAGAELSSAYQDYESKRLENEWTTRLRKRFPVVENQAALRSAFPPAAH